MSTTIEPTVRVETPRRQPMPPRERLETIFHVDDLDALYSGKPALKEVTMEIYKNSSRRSSVVRLWQEHVHRCFNR